MVDARPSSHTMNTVDAAAASAVAYTRVCTHEGCCPESFFHFEYLENRSRGFDVTWQPVRVDLTVHQ